VRIICDILQYESFCTGKVTSLFILSSTASKVFILSGRTGNYLEFCQYKSRDKQIKHSNHGSGPWIWFQCISWLSNCVKHSVVKDWTKMMFRCQNSNQHVQTPAVCTEHHTNTELERYASAW